MFSNIIRVLEYNTTRRGGDSKCYVHWRHLGRCERRQFALAAARLGDEATGGGRDRDRTCDPYHVKVVLYR
jgi:hypothetical protein